VNHLSRPDGKQYTQEEYDKKIQWIAGQLDKMDCDIIGFQEVIHGDALEDAIKASLCYQEKPATLVMGVSGDLHRMAVLSRFPIVHHDSVREFPEEAIMHAEEQPSVDYFQRPVLRAKIRLPTGITCTVMITHLKSQRPIIPRSTPQLSQTPTNAALIRAIGMARALLRRTAEAVALRALVLHELHTSTDPLVLVGDLNGASEATTTELISGSEPSRKLPKQERMAIWDTLLSNVKDIQARQSFRDVYFTYIYNGHYESLDHIFVSSSFVRRNPHHVGYVEYVRVFNDHLVDETISRDELPKWQSDHGQPVVTIKLCKSALPHQHPHRDTDVPENAN